jgi:transcriptional regulator with XRE-family HTH domain
MADSDIRRMEKLTRKRIGERIKSTRLERTFSLNQLARKSGLSCSTIHKIEQHRMVPTVTTLLKIARGLDKEVNFFIEDEDSLRGFKVIRKEGSTISAIKPQCALIRAVSSRFNTTKLEVHHTVIGKGGKNGKEYLFHHSEEVAICLKGRWNSC